MIRSRFTITGISLVQLAFKPKDDRYFAAFLPTDKAGTEYRLPHSTALEPVISAYSASIIPIRRCWSSGSGYCAGAAVRTNKSLKCLRAISLFHLYPCIKYELLPPVTELSAPPVSSPLCNALIPVWLTGEPLRLLIGSLLFKDLFVLRDYCQRWSQTGIHGRKRDNWRSVHYFSSWVPYLRWDCFEGFRSFASVILKLQMLHLSCLRWRYVKENEV